MKFALLGVDAAVLALVRSIAAGNDHQLVGYSLAEDDPSRPAASTAPSGELAEELRRLAPVADGWLDWELLLSGRAADAVIVAGAVALQPWRFEQLRRLVQQGVPVVASHPVTFSVLEAYEVEVVREEAGGVVVPLLPLRWFALSRRLAALVESTRTASAESGPLGRIEQIVWERRLSSGSREAVFAQFARDVDFIRVLCGEITQVAGLGGSGGGSPAELVPLGVQMTGPAGILVRWNAERAATTPDGKLTLVGNRGRATLAMPDEEEGRWQLDSASPGLGSDAAMSESGAGRVELADLVAAAVVRAKDRGPSADDPTWSDATRSLELVEALEKSLRRGRTVSLSFEGRGETDAFKGTMASLGCGVLVGGLVLVVFAAVVLKIAQKTNNQLLVDIFRWWPALLLCLFGIFLVLQLLRFIIPEQDRAAESDTSRERPDPPSARR